MTSVSFSGLDPFKLIGVQLTQRELGSGSYATVYEVNHLGLKCAGKKIHEVLLKQGGGPTYALTRFEEECRLLSRMHHPNIVQFLGIYFEKGMRVPILVMEFLSTDLASCIVKNGVLRSEISYSILHDVALGLNYLHSHTPPIIHRDLSSSNILLASNMRAKISDLGVAKILNLTPLQVSRVVRNTQAPGTAACMPPEALIANPTYDTSIDVFSFGVMMIHVLSGKWPEPQGVPVRTEHGRMIPVSEAERRDVFLCIIGDEHPLMDLIRKCIDNDCERRPRVDEIVPRLTDMVAKNPPSFSNQLEMLREIEKEKQKQTVLREEGKQKEKALKEVEKTLSEEKTEELRQRISRLESELRAAKVKQGTSQHVNCQMIIHWDGLLCNLLYMYARSVTL